MPSTPRRERRERSWLGRATLAVLLLSLGVATLGDGLGWWTVWLGDLAAGGLIILGAALVLGAWRGRARWLFLVALLILPVAIAGKAFDGLGLPMSGASGERVVLPAVEDGQAIRHFAGEVTVDLSEIPYGPSPAGDDDTFEVDVDLTFGQVNVWVPEDMRLELEASIGAGEIRTDRQARAGVGVSMSEGTGSEASGRTVRLRVNVGAGQIIVRRGTPTASTFSITEPDETVTLEEIR